MGNQFLNNGDDGLGVVAGWLGDNNGTTPDAFDTIDLDFDGNVYRGNGDDGVDLDLLADVRIDVESDGDVARLNMAHGLDLDFASSNGADFVMNIDDLFTSLNGDDGLDLEALTDGAGGSIDFDLLNSSARLNGADGFDALLDVRNSMEGIDALIDDSLANLNGTAGDDNGFQLDLDARGGGSAILTLRDSNARSNVNDGIEAVVHARVGGSAEFHVDNVKANLNGDDGFEADVISWGAGKAILDIDTLRASDNAEDGLDFFVGTIGKDDAEVNLDTIRTLRNGEDGIEGMVETHFNGSARVVGTNIRAHDNGLPGSFEDGVDIEVYSDMTGGDSFIDLSDVVANGNDEKGLELDASSRADIDSGGNVTVLLDDIRTRENGGDGIDLDTASFGGDTMVSLTDINSTSNGAFGIDYVGIALAGSISVVASGVVANANADVGGVLIGLATDDFSVDVDDVTANDNGILGGLNILGGSATGNVDITAHNVEANNNGITGLGIAVGTLPTFAGSDVNILIGNVTATGNFGAGVGIGALGFDTINISNDAPVLANDNGLIGVGVLSLNLGFTGDEEINIGFDGVTANGNGESGIGIIASTLPTPFALGPPPAGTQAVNLVLNDIEANENGGSGIFGILFADDELSVDVTASQVSSNLDDGAFLDLETSTGDVDLNIDGVTANSNRLDGIHAGVFAASAANLTATGVVANWNGENGISLFADAGSNVTAMVEDITVNNNASNGLFVGLFGANAGGTGTNLLLIDGLTAVSNGASGAALDIGGGTDWLDVSVVNLVNMNTMGNTGDGVSLDVNFRGDIFVNAISNNASGNRQNGFDFDLNSDLRDVEVVLDSNRAVGNGLDATQMPLGFFDGLEITGDAGSGSLSNGVFMITGRNNVFVNNADHGVDVGVIATAAEIVDFGTGAGGSGNEGNNSFFDNGNEDVYNRDLGTNFTVQVQGNFWSNPGIDAGAGQISAGVNGTNGLPVNPNP